MEEQEPPIEHVVEDVHHHAETAQEHWVSAVALSTAILAALAAVTSLLSGHHANEAMLAQIRAASQWDRYHFNNVKSSVLLTKTDILQALGKDPERADLEKVEEYQEKRDKLTEEARGEEHESKTHLEEHLILARGVTMFQIAISVAAISVLTRRKWFWYLGLGLGAAGTFFLIQGVLPPGIGP